LKSIPQIDNTLAETIYENGEIGIPGFAIFLTAISAEILPS
jgi:hypothetical protein